MTKIKRGSSRHSPQVQVESAPKKRAAEKAPPHASEVLREVYELLEDYAPTWYSKSMSNRIQAALRAGSEAGLESNQKKPRR